MKPVAILAASALGAHGADWRGVAGLIRAGAAFASPCAELGGVVGAQVPVIPAAIAVEPRARKLMHRGAELACSAMRALLVGGVTAEAQDGMFLGVGASGIALHEVQAMVPVSFEGPSFSQARFATEGLLACNPLFAFQMMNNFTLCHPAIRHGLQGPNAALFSRGAGTVGALAEAMAAVNSGECERAIAGGADSALHPITWSELRRDRDPPAVPGEGAALVLLAPQAAGSSRRPLRDVGEEFTGAGSGSVGLLAGPGRGTGGQVMGTVAPGASSAEAAGLPARSARVPVTGGVPTASGADLSLGFLHRSEVRRASPLGVRETLSALAAFEPSGVVLAACGAHRMAEWSRSVVAALPASELLASSSIFGEALAASAALGLLVALDLLREGAGRAALVVAGPDGELGLVCVSRSAS